jgi:hypothetical protein
MLSKKLTVILLVFFSLVELSLVAAGKDKKKATLPPDILKAHTVWVIVDPTAGVDINDPRANQIARADVEKAMVRWGRLEPVTNADMADLIITVRKGHDKIADGTIAGTPINRPPPVIAQSTDSSIHAAGGTRGGQIPGAPIDASTSGDPGSLGDNGYPSRPSPQAEFGASQDMFAVYRSHVSNALKASPVWRYTAKDGLESPDVPAVDAFRDLVVQSEKQLAGKP